ncbi:hypothetical protein F5Y14DRAFT_201651 [Nemania sp. NC0429]|nr:hypothetical protein F5Y14DRAFT_201651 [Nemania sp. NC0429]
MAYPDLGRHCVCLGPRCRKSFLCLFLQLPIVRLQRPRPTIQAQFLMTSQVLISVFQCIPPYAFWERFDPVNPLDPSQFHCGVDTKRFFCGNSIPNILTDHLTVILVMV